MKSICLLLFFVQLTLSSYSQDPPYWVGADFEVILRDVKWDKFKSNYSVKATGTYYDAPEHFFFKDDFRGDTLHFDFGAQWSLDTLIFVLKNHTSQAEMKVTVLHMYIHQSYFIHLTLFKPGNFLFDWSKISECQEENLSPGFIRCYGKTIYQMHRREEVDIYVHRKIAPVDIREFAVR